MKILCVTLDFPAPHPLAFGKRMMPFDFQTANEKDNRRAGRRNHAGTFGLRHSKVKMSAKCLIRASNGAAISWHDVVSL
jgi:hypothetical protein